MVRQEKSISDEFLSYQDYIVQHPNYSTLPNKTNHLGEITWVKVKDVERGIWWDELKHRLGLPNRASAARAIHPDELRGYKPCQLCGRSMSVFYVYPNKNLIHELNKKFNGIQFNHFEEEIYSVTQRIYDHQGMDGLNILAKCLRLEKGTWTVQDLSAAAMTRTRLLSPGVMSNAPDRLD